ncbi:MAG TPA: DUF418 domain-containing protein [Opitutales bacterium]|nr:DUF418 domain-containing protein [Opitutales bacterium]
MSDPSRRIDSVDALRGFALAGIMLLHNVEQFNFYHTPDKQLPFLSSLDPAIWTSVFFVFGGKAYAIFSMLFGFSFWVMYEGLLKKGYDFGRRFVWRLFLLFGFGLIHSLYYTGDLLIFYSTFGLCLVLTRKWPDWIVLVCSIALLALPLNLFHIARCALDPAFVPPAETNWAYWGGLAPAQGGGTFWELVKADVSWGLPANVLWTWESGRMFHIPGLFLLGMLAARRKVFTETSSRKWAVAAVLSVATFGGLLVARQGMETVAGSESLHKLATGTLGSYSDVAFMVFLVAGFILLWRVRIGERLFRVLVPYGRMSLTNYLSQALIGTFVYYQYGLGLHHYCGGTLSIMVGAVLLAAQVAFSHWWLARHAQGPLETLWRKLMWLDRQKPA